MTRHRPPLTPTDLRRAIKPGTEITRTSSLLPTATVTVTRVTTKGWYHAHTVRGRTVRGYTPWGPAAATTVHGDAPWRWDVNYRHGSVHYEATNAAPRRLPGEPLTDAELTARLQLQSVDIADGYGDWISEGGDWALTEQDQYDGPKGGSIGTMEDGVAMSDKRGREIYLRWPDAIRYARTILLAADVRGLIPAAEAPLTLWQLAENEHMTIRQDHELLDRVSASRSETHGNWESPHDGAPNDMYGDDVDG